MFNHHIYQYHLFLFNQSNQQEVEHYIDADMELMAGYDYAQYKRHMDTMEFLESIGC